ncbi:MOP flippase family protein [Deltaproteobacteria bacterium TL4]
MSSNLKVIRGVQWTAISTLITAILQLALLAILARFLTPDEFGLMAIVSVVIGFAQAFIDMGVSNAIIHHQEVSHEQLSSLYWFNILTGILLFGILIVFLPVIASFYQEPRLIALIAWVAVSFLILPFGMQFRILLQKELMFSILSKIEIVGRTISFVLALALAIEGFGIYALVFELLSNALIITIMFVWAGLKLHRPSLHFRWDDLHGFLSFGLYQTGERSLNFFTSNLDKLVIGKLFGMELLGHYNLASQLVTRPIFVINAIANKVTFPVYAKIQQDLARLNQIYIDNIARITFFTFPLYLGMFAVAKEMIDVFYGEGWGQTIEILNMIWIIGLVISTGNPIGSYLMALGKTNVGFYMNVSYLIVLSLTFLLGMLLDFWDFLIVYVGLRSLFLVVQDYYVRYKLTGMSLRQHGAELFKNLAVSLVMLGVVLAIKPYVQVPHNLSHLIILIIVGALAYALSTCLIRPLFIKKLLGKEP